MLCKNEKQKVKESQSREELISKVKDLIVKKASVKQKRKKQAVCASVGKIFGKYKIEKFFSWSVNDTGKLSWSLKQKVIDAEKKLDGCYIIKSNASVEKLDKNNVVESYRGLQQVEQAFKNMKTILLELRPIYHKTDERIMTHIFIVMLSYYLQWHAVQKLKPLFESDAKGKDKRWTIEGAISSLQGIKLVENLINNIVVKINISTQSETQTQILKLLEVSIKN